jgi:hypothetical protein
MSKYTINRRGKDYTFESPEKYEEFYNMTKDTAKRHGVSTADVFDTQYRLYADNTDTNPSSVGIIPDRSFPDQKKINETLDRILNREKFEFDINGDALYNQYKDMFTELGNMAMEDTMGKASAMTGGYGNSYAQSVGQQAYNAKLQELNDMVPEFYQIALDRYNQEGQGLLEDFSRLLSERDTYLDGIASSSTDGIDDYTKWLMEYNLDAAKAGYSVDAYGNLVPKEEEPKSVYTGKYKMTASELREKLDSMDDTATRTNEKGETVLIPTIGPISHKSADVKRAVQLLKWRDIREITEEDLDFLAEEYEISDEAMDLALEIVYGK